MIAGYVDHLKALVHQSELGQFRWLTWFTDKIDLLAGPLTGVDTRFYWPELVDALAIAAVIFIVRERIGGR